MQDGVIRTTIAQLEMQIPESQNHLLEQLNLVKEKVDAFTDNKTGNLIAIVKKMLGRSKLYREIKRITNELNPTQDAEMQMI